MRAAVARSVGFILAAVGGVGGLMTGLAMCGCESGGGSGPAVAQGPPASPVQHTMLQNIPLPVGFRMVPERSVARESGQFRVAQCEFEGATSPDAVTRFYVEYMPTAKFTLRQKRFDNGEYLLRFESDAEECNVRVRPSKSQTILVIDIGPLAKGSAERESQPPLPRR
jgi:hypothetical protein